MTAFKVGTAYFGSYFMIPIRMGVVRDLRNQLYRKIVSLPIGFFLRRKKGDIMSRMMNDVNEVEISIMSSLEMMFRIRWLSLFILGLCWPWAGNLLFCIDIITNKGWLIGRIGRNL